MIQGSSGQGELEGEVQSWVGRCHREAIERGRVEEEEEEGY